MPGTVVRDALAPDLLDGLDLDDAGTETGSSVELVWPAEVAFALETGTVTGTSPSITVTIQGSDLANFAAQGANVVTVGSFGTTSGTAASQSDRQYTFSTYVDKRYVRAVAVVGGTTPDYSGSTLKAVGPHDRRVRSSTTSA
jgi:hypothetical protein